MITIFFGDSIVQGFWAINGGWVDRIRKHFDSIALQDLKNNKQPEVYNLGVDGDTTKGLLSRIENETKTRKWPGDQLTVVISIGINDYISKPYIEGIDVGEYRDNLEKIISILTPIADNIILIGDPSCDESRTLPVFWGDFYYSNKAIEQSEQIRADIAKIHGLKFIPVFEKFKSKMDAGENLLVDGLHPNDAGHQYIAELVLSAIADIVN